MYYSIKAYRSRSSWKETTDLLLSSHSMRLLHPAVALYPCLSHGRSGVRLLRYWPAPTDAWGFGGEPRGCIISAPRGQAVEIPRSRGREGNVSPRLPTRGAS